VNPRTTPYTNPAALVDMRLSRSALRHALGPRAAPATLHFTRAGVTVTTPCGSVRITPDTLRVLPAGIVTAGLRPADADLLRAAADGPDLPADLTVDALTLTLTDPATGPTSTVTVGHW
jgi:hypothetical protein